MRQFNYEFTSVNEVDKAMQEVYSYTLSHPYRSILFHLYSIMFDDEQVGKVQRTIMEIYPDASICGTSSNGDICDGHLADYGLVMAVSVFDSTEVRTRLFNCVPGQEEKAGEQIRELIDNTEGIKAAEILITLKSINSHIILNQVERCNENVKIFGGGSAAVDISGTDTKVISSDSVCHSGIMVATYSGDDFNIDIHHAIGWKPLGKDLTVTKIAGKKLYELDNVAAASVYSKYLDIQAGDDFFSNMLEFPIMSTQHGQHVLRLPFSCDSTDGSIILAADLDEGTTVNLSYGDPDVIRGDVSDLTEHVRTYAPQAIFLYSCGVRRLYWKYLINKETGPFSQIAPVSGFYSSGEIMRMDNFLIEHHVTLIAISMREGSQAKAQPTGDGDKKIEMTDEQKIHGQISMVRRLANFINVTAAELRAANEELQLMADTDELTGLSNRRVIDKLIRTAIEHAHILNFNIILGIIDIDDFKQINDTYGHTEGDKVLVKITEIAREKIEQIHGGKIGRWGGEEFLFVLPKINLDEGKKALEEIRLAIKNQYFEGIGYRTISIGITEIRANDTANDVFRRADEALYEAKGTGKNKVCVR